MEWISDLIARERKCIQELRPLGNFNPGGSTDKLALLNHFEAHKARLWPDVGDAGRLVLWHGGLHQDHIFVDPINTSKVLSIISWQGVHIAPLFSQIRIPAFLDFDSPKPIPIVGVVSVPPLPENFNQLEVNEQKKALELLKHQTVWNNYRIHAWGRIGLPFLR